MLHNHVMSAQEILDSISNLKVNSQKEGMQRIMLVLRSTWVFMLSVVEYSIKKIIRESKSGPLAEWYQNLDDDPKVVGKKWGYSLRSVIKESHKLNLISDEHYQNWISLQDMRNAIIHNNAIVEKRSVFTIGNFTRTIEVGKKVKSNHQDRANFIRLIPLMAREWLERYLIDQSSNTS